MNKDILVKNILLNGFILSSSCLVSVASVYAGSLNLATKPLYTGTTEAPMMMLVMGRDHTLYYEAYNDASDLDGDGAIDIKFMPEYDYEGYFNVDACYTYNTWKTFIPVELATTDSSICGTSAAPWSGNFLNYLTMTRMDVLRKVLYGGTRSYDINGNTKLKRVYIPQDAHSWAKAYTSVGIDGYDISNYTPYALPNDSNKAHFFGSVTYTSDSSEPILRVLENQNISGDNAGVWDWASTERPVLNATGDDYEVRVRVCKSGILESNCQLYPNGNYKPTGLLHDYGESDDMFFGLLTGSFNKNLSGGVLRNAISEFSREIISNTGIFDSSVEGIVSTINKLQIHGFRYSDKSYQTNCGWIANRAITEGECASWGNPIGEMLYETMRYFSGAEAASSSYAYSDSALGYDESLDLPVPDWDDPYEDRGTCANPNILIISDKNPSYDSDQLPGAYSEFSDTYEGTTLVGDDGTDFSITTLLEAISSTEGKTSGEYFIGQSDTDNDNAPTVKTITGLESIRGLAPAEPTKQGSYSSAGVAYFGLNNDIHPDKSADQNVTTMVVELTSNLPEITAYVGDNAVKIVPFAKTVKGNYGGLIDSTEGEFQPTNTIVDWYIESISDTKGVFRINFEDVEQGADHDMDMIASYTYEVKDICTEYDNDNDNGDCETYTEGLEVSIDSISSAGSLVQHAGYIISGTTNDGMYLEVRDRSTNDGADYAYYLDTPDTDDYTTRAENGSTAFLTYESTRNFFTSEDEAAEFLPSPLWYAAKWGGFTDGNNNNKPDLESEWDTDGDGDPDNYFPVTNAGELKDQLSAAFDLAYDGSVSSTSSVFSSDYLTSGTLVYQSAFEEVTWSGDIDAYEADEDGVYPTTATWNAAEQLDFKTVSERKIFTRQNDATGNVFEFVATNLTTLISNSLSFTSSQLLSLLGDSSGTDVEKLAYLNAVVNYTRGDRSHESDTTYGFRERTGILGDIINSTPYLVGSSNNHDVGKEVLVFGANDGMVHILDAATGDELAAYIPSGVYDALGNMVDSAYIHEYSVDGGINAYSDETDEADISTTLVGRLGLGVQGLYAIDVSDMTTPTADMMKWEITTTTTGFDGLGYSIAAPTMATLATGDVGVIFSNGYNSSDDDGALYIANLTDGSLIKKLSVGTQSDPTGLDRANALAEPAIIDENGDGIADYIYAGDLFGNMWVFDISSDDTSNWGVKTNDSGPLFTAYSPTIENGAYMPQSITSRPSVSRHPDGVALLISFGTGKYVESEDTDVDDQATQTFYVIADQLDGTSITASRDTTNGNQFTNTSSVIDKLSNLQVQSIEEESDTNRLLSTNTVNWDVVSGFYLDLVNTEEGNTENYGERQVGNSSVLSNKVTFITIIPNEDSCTAGGTGWYMSLNLYTGQTWDLGSAVEDDPDTNVDESLEIPTDSSNTFLDGIGTGMTSVVSTTSTTTTTDEDGNTVIETNSGDLSIQTCVTLSTGSVVCFDDDTTAIGRLSWRNLY